MNENNWKTHLVWWMNECESFKINMIYVCMYVNKCSFILMRDEANNKVAMEQSSKAVSK